MCRGPILRITEVRRAADFRARGFKWRTIGKMLRRNHSALFKAVRKLATTSRPIPAPTRWVPSRRTDIPWD